MSISPISRLANLNYRLDLWRKDVSDEFKIQFVMPVQIQSQADVMKRIMENFYTIQTLLQRTGGVNPRLSSLLAKLQHISQEIIVTAKGIEPSEVVQDTTIQRLVKKALDFEKSIQHIRSLPPREIRKEGRGGIGSWLWDKVCSPVIGKAVKIAGVPLASYFLNIRQSEKERVDAGIEQYTERLALQGDGTSARKFATQTSKFLVQYLSEHLLHVEERDPSLRDPFLKSFFIDPYVPKPVPGVLGDLVIPLLKTHSEIFEKIFRLNILKGISSLYENVQRIQREQPYLFVELVRSSLVMASAHIKMEDDVRKRQGLGELSPEERQELLKGTLQKSITKSLLSLAFPNGVKDLVIPDFLPSVPGKAQAMNRIEGKVWEVLQKGLDEFFYSVFTDLSENDDVKDSLLLTGYKQILSLLEDVPEAPGAERAVKTNPIGFFTFGFVATLIKVMFTSIKENLRSKKSATTPYPNQAAFNSIATDIVTDLVKATSWPSFLQKKISATLVEKMGPSVVEAIKEIELTQIFDSLFSNFQDEIEASPVYHIPRTFDDVRAVEERREIERTERQVLLNEAEERVGSNLSGVIDSIWKYLKLKDPKPPHAEVGMKAAIYRFQRYVVHSINAGLHRLLRFAFWISKMGTLIHDAGIRLRSRTGEIQQDVVLSRFVNNFVDEMAPKTHFQSILHFE